MTSDSQVKPMTGEQVINTVFDGPSHIVILGSGASRASALHNSPEPSGRKLPLMDDLVEVVGLTDIIRSIDHKGQDANFEVLYSALYAQDPSSPLLKEIEKRVRDYFECLRLPPTPTIYDYLVLSLRPKDLIATFNWDPFLYQAFSRNRHAGGMPFLSFLHGNVAIGYSVEEQRSGPAGWMSRATGHEYVPTKLLYPVAQKNYNSDEFTMREWERFKRWLKGAKRITIFGYGAPDTDVEAVELMSSVWGDPNLRNLEQVEIIDTQPESVIRERWKRFIHTHHYDCCNSYFGSVLSFFPRRTGEAFMWQFLPSTASEALGEPNPVPQHFDALEDMWEWFRPLIEAENRHSSGRQDKST